MRRRLLSLLSAAATLPAGHALADAPLPFAEAVFTEVVNDVQVVHRADASAVKAEKDTKFSAPDFVKTGRKSRAQLTAADGTVARIGSNAVFSFDKDTRTINLEKGSVLFHSPTGKGGGTIVTNSATASVVGTTIIVAATPDGGFKMMVLEGVAKVTFPNGTVATVNAGQMTFVRPGATVEKVDDSAGNKKAAEPQPEPTPQQPGPGATKPEGERGPRGPRPEGRPGPVLNFDLAAVNEAGLLSGFKTELPSKGKIEFARQGQAVRVREGELGKTGLVILGGGSGEQEFQVIPQDQLTAIFQQIVQNPQQRLLDVASKPLDLDGTKPVPDAFIFRTAVQLPAELIPQGVKNPASLYLQGVAAGNLRFTGQAFDLGFMSGTSHTDVVGFRTLELGSVDFRTAPGTTSLRIAGGQVLITAGATLSAGLDGTVVPGRATRFEIVSFSSPAYDRVTFENATGDIALVATSGDLRLIGGTVNAAPALGHAELSADQGVVRLNGTQVHGGLTANIFGATGVEITGGGVTAAHVDINTTGGPVALTATTVNGTGANSIFIAGTGVQLADTTLTSPGRVDINARTGTAALTHTQIAGTGLAISGGALNLVGGNFAPATDGRGTITPNATFDAGTGQITLLAVNDLTVSGYQLLRGAAVRLSADRFDLTDARIESTAGGITANFFEGRLSQGEIHAQGDLVLDANRRDTTGTILAPGKLETFAGAALRSTAANVLVSAGQARLHDTNLQAVSGRVEVRTAGELTLDTNSSVSALQVNLSADSGAITLDNTHIQATGAPLTNSLTSGQLTQAPSATLMVTDSTQASAGTLVLTTPPAGINIAGNGITLAPGTTLDAGNGAITLDARTFDISATRPTLTGSGVAIRANGARITLTGQGGSEDAQGNVIFGGTVSAGSKQLQINARDLISDGYVELSGDTASVNLTGDANLHFTRITSATTGVLDFRAANLTLAQAELVGGTDLNVIVGSAFLNHGDLRSSGRILLQSPGDLLLDTAHIDAILGVLVRTDRDFTWTNGNITANGLKITGLPGVAGETPANTISITGLNTSIPAGFDGSASIVLVANTIALENVAFSASSAVLLRSKTGLGNGYNPGSDAAYSIQGDKLNAKNVSFAGQDIVTSQSNLVWIPKQNIGDVTAPIHVLDFTTPDFRGSKLDYSRSHDLTGADFSRITDSGNPAPAIPNSHTFRQGEPAILDNADFGLPATETLPMISDATETGHSPLEVKGILARNIHLTGPFSLDLSPLNPDLNGGELLDRVDLVATNSLTWSDNFTVFRTSESHRRLEIRARQIIALAGASFTNDLPFNPDSFGDASTVFFAAIENAVFNGNPDRINTITNPVGSVEIGSARGDVILYHTKVYAGDASVDLTDPQNPLLALQPGTVRLSTMSAGRKIQINGGLLRGRVANAFDTGIDLAAETVDLAGVILRAESKATHADAMNTSGPGNTPGLTGVESVNPGDDLASGKIAIRGAKLAKISNGTLFVARDIDLTVDDPNSTNTSDPNTDAIDLDGASFRMTGSQNGTGIAMSAKTVNLANLVFPDNVQVRLKAKDGNLNIGTKMFGAVNFVNNVGIRTNGSIGQVTPLTTEAGINTKVWIENHSPTNTKVFFNGAPAPASVTGTGDNLTAPIHIQSTTSPNLDGRFGRQAL